MQLEVSFSNFFPLSEICASWWPQVLVQYIEQKRNRLNKLEKPGNAEAPFRSFWLTLLAKSTSTIISVTKKKKNLQPQTKSQ